MTDRDSSLENIMRFMDDEDVLDTIDPLDHYDFYAVIVWFARVNILVRNVTFHATSSRNYRLEVTATSFFQW